jgi:hypothetical protein
MRTLVSSIILLSSLAVLACSAPAPSDAESSDDALSVGGVALHPVPPRRPPPVVFQLRPDLVAVDASGNIDDANNGFNLCSFGPNGTFIVRVKNQGAAAAPASITVVNGGRGSVAIPTPALAVGQTVQLVANFDSFAQCSPDCFFTITVDAANQVTESDESNAFGGWCIG